MTEARKKHIYYSYLEIIRDVRRVNSRTQAKVAEAAGLSTRFVNLLEKRQRLPTLESLIALGSAAGVSRKTISDMVQEVIDEHDWEG